MAIRVRRFPEHELTLDIWSGTVPPEEIVAHYEAMTPSDAGRRINYIGPDVDLPGVDVMTLPAIKRAVASKLNELYAGRPLASAIVCSPGANREVVDFWLRYGWHEEAAGDPPTACCTLEEACERLGLSEAACAAVNEAVKDDALAAASEAAPQSSPGSPAPSSMR